MNKRTKAECVKALMDFVTDYEYETPEETEQALRDAGYDPTEVVKRLRTRIAQAIENAKERESTDGQ